MAEGENTHQVLLGEGEYLQGQVEERGVTQGGGKGGFGSEADKGIHNSPCTHPNPGRVGEQPGPRKTQEEGWERTTVGLEPLGWGAQGLVNIDHSQKGMGVGEGSPYTSSQG